ncbi:MAG: XisI protein [Cyanobacteria bacterium J06614_10]
MDTLEQWREAIRNSLQYYADIPYNYGDVKTYIVTSEDRNHFMLMREGWEGHRRIHGCVVHVEIRDSKIWMHYDGIEDSITTDLVAAGIPKKRIVLAFHPVEVREHTEYAVA